MTSYSIWRLNLPSVSASVSATQRRFVVHDCSKGAQIFNLDSLLEIPDAMIPYDGPHIIIPVLYLETDTILVGDNGEIKVHNSEGISLGVLGVKAGE